MLLENSSLYNVLSRRYSRKTESLINAKRKICCKPNSESAERAKYITTKSSVFKNPHKLFCTFCLHFNQIPDLTLWQTHQQCETSKTNAQTTRAVRDKNINYPLTLLTFLNADTRLIIVFASYTWQQAKKISNSGTNFNKKNHLLGFTCLMITTQKQASFFI